MRWYLLFLGLLLVLSGFTATPNIKIIFNKDTTAADSLLAPSLKTLDSRRVVTSTSDNLTNSSTGFSEEWVDAPPEIQTIINSITNTRYRENVYALANDFDTRMWGTDGNSEAATYLLTWFREQAGLDAYLHNFSASGANVIATIPSGNQQNDACIVVGAHFDTYPIDSPGADDDASGVSAVMEIARAMAQYAYNYTLIFVAFNAEEIGLVGSAAFASYLVSQNVPVAVAYNFDMIMWNNPNAPADHKIDIIHNGGLSASFAIQAASRGKQWVSAPVQAREAPGWTMSDHSPFWDRGIPAIWYFENGAMENGHGIHSPADSTDHPEYSYDLGTQVTKAAAAAIADTAVIVSNRPGFPHPVFIAPENAPYVYPNEAVPITLHIQDTLNDITRVDISTDGVTWTDVTTGLNATNHCNFLWNASSLYGPVSLRARVNDAANWVAYTQINLIVDKGTNCVLHSPQPNEEIPQGKPYIVSIEANDLDGYPLKRIEVRINETQWIQATPTPTLHHYYYNWTPSEPGTTIIEARAVDTNNRGSTKQVSVTVRSFLPIITDVQWVPLQPSASDPIHISCRVTEDSRGFPIKLILVTYSVNGRPWANLQMALTDSPTHTYSTTFRPQPTGAHFQFYIRVWDTIDNIALNDNNGNYYTLIITLPPILIIGPIGGITGIAVAIIGILYFRRRRAHIKTHTERFDTSYESGQVEEYEEATGRYGDE